MSSTTDRPAQRGQTLVVFALFLGGLFAFAALALDGGQMLLDKRAQQNAADSAALAGARYLLDPANPTTSAPCGGKTSPSYCATAVSAALGNALANHYGDGTSDGVAANGATVTVHIPPTSGQFAGRSGFIQVQIGTNRPSVVGGILGILNLPVGVSSTAANYNGATLNASLLALNPNMCQSAFFTGNGTVSVSGNIQVDSMCTGTNPANSAFSAGGSSTVTVTSPSGAINVVGSAYYGGSSSVTPGPTEGAPYVPDPFANVPAPTDKTPPAAAKLQGSPSTRPPNGCPGSTRPATDASPDLCKFNTAGQIWLLSPGYYPGGLEVGKGTVYLQPGIYFIGGGGVKVGGNQAAIYSVPAGYSLSTPPVHTLCDAAPSPLVCGAVMIYNSSSANAAFANIDVGANGAYVQLYPSQTAPYAGIVIFQDRTQALGTSTGDVTLQGNNGTIWVTGAIYAPSGFVDVTGTGAIGAAVQIIGDHFRVAGSGTLSIPFDSDLLPRTRAAGLVE